MQLKIIILSELKKTKKMFFFHVRIVDFIQKHKTMDDTKVEEEFQKNKGEEQDEKGKQRNMGK